MHYLAIGLGIAIAAIGGMVYLAAIAPTGYEDDDGFHYGEPDRDDIDWWDM